ncbi:Neutral ceramidase [Quaeritorhiza haematococci]|nr:Neutral ceramidase [Quaeritorhiza haematococci]
MMGYAMLDQMVNGIHLRLKARAFIFAAASQPSKRVVFVSIDAGQVSHQTVKLSIARLSERLGSSNSSVSSLYSIENVMVSATHTHSGPAGYLDNLLYHITSLGVVPGQREAIAAGIAEAIYAAHQNLETSEAGTQMELRSGILTDASVNRSPTAYLANPPEERARYGADVDQEMTLLAIKNHAAINAEQTEHKPALRGIVSWFAVHETSMNNTNVLVSGDNKGFASYSWETEQHLAGNTEFVAAFAQSNAGFDKGGDRLSTRIIGARQLSKAKDILESPSKPPVVITGSGVDYRHVWVDITNVTVELPNGSTAKTCKAAMGYAFSAGTTDGPATRLSWQGDNSTEGSNKLLDHVRNLVIKPSEELKKCQAPKPILLPTGEIKFPYPWQPAKLPLQLFLIGRKLVIIGFPAEITTMAGRRLREAVLRTLQETSALDDDAYVVLAGLSNSYASYDTPPPEIDGLSVLPPVVLDTAQFGKKFGDVLEQPPATVEIKTQQQQSSPSPSTNTTLEEEVKELGSTKVSAKFVCAHPRNGGGNSDHNRNVFMAVEKLDEATGQWSVFLDDSGWDTKYVWKRKGVSESVCTVQWDIGSTFPVPGEFKSE